MGSHGVDVKWGGCVVSLMGGVEAVALGACCFSLVCGGGKSLEPGEEKDRCCDWVRRGGEGFRAVDGRLGRERMRYLSRGSERCAWQVCEGNNYRCRFCV